MNDLFEAVESATPLSDEGKKGLIPKHISFKHELNELEQANILKALSGLGTLRRRPLLNLAAIQSLHKKMFEDVWKWAGEFRKSELNLGVEFYKIPPMLLADLEQSQYWLDNEIHSPDEVAIRLHHRLTLIHPFENGNGRHARMVADILAEQYGQTPFTWGGANLAVTGKERKAYIEALQQADRHNLEPLLKIARQ